MKINIDDDIDELFRLPLMEFTAARNALAARLKKANRSDDAEQVKSLVKPSVSAWALNQLYWKHRDAFEELVAAGGELRRTHSLRLTGQTADTRGPSAARREAVSLLSRLADALLRDAGHSPTTDTMRRITATLEALSTSASSPGTRAAGRLTSDLDLPGFESLTPLLPATGRVAPEAPKVTATATAALKAAETTLRECQAKSRDLAAALKDATARAEATQRDLTEAAERLKEATVAAEEARERARNLASEAEHVARLLADAVHRRQRRGQQARPVQRTP